MTIKNTYKVPEERLASLQAKIAKINRKAQKLGFPPIEMTVGDSELVPYKDMFFRIFDVTITGETPNINGWQFVAVIEQVGEMNMLRIVPGNGFVVPARFRSAPADRCEHCNINRYRVSTFLLYSEQFNEWKQVGSSCLKDFTGAHNPHAAAAWAECIFDIEEYASDEDYDPFASGGQELLFDTEYYMAVVAMFIRLDGWMSRGKAYEENTVSTSDLATNFILRNLSDEKYQVLDEDVDRALAAIRWSQEIDEFTSNDYLYNLKVSLSTEALKPKNAGIAASGIFAYNREQARKEEAKQYQVSEWIGEVGQKGVNFENLTCINVMTYEGHYGIFNINVFRDEQGNSIVYKGGQVYDKGQKYNFIANIKSHETYGKYDIKQTVINYLRKVREVE